MHQNSLHSYRATSEMRETDRSKIYKLVLEKGGMTDAQICEDLGWKEVYKSRRRTSELVKDKWFYELGSIDDPTGKHRWRVYAARTAKERDAFLREESQIKLQVKKNKEPLQLDLFKAA